MAKLLSLRRVSTALSLLLFAAVASALTVDFGPVTVFVGNSDMPGQSTGHGTGPTGSTFTGPTGCTFDSNNNFYIADTSNHVLRRVGIGADTATVFAGNFNSSGDVEGTGGNARFGSPMDMQYATDGNLYVADFAQHRIFQVTLAGAVTRYAGTGLSGLANGQGTNAEFNAPAFMAFRPGTSDIEFWVTEQGSHRIRKLNGRNVNSFVGSETGLFGDTNGIGTVVRLRVPAGIVLDPAGTTIYLADSGNFKIKSITNPGGQAIQLAGGGSAGDVDGPGTSSRFRQPWGMVMDRQGRFLYIADKSANYVKRMEISSLVVDTVWGHDGAGWSNAPVSFQAQVASPAGLCMQYTSTYTRLFLTGAHSVAYASRRTTRSKTFSLYTNGPNVGGPDGSNSPNSPDASSTPAPGVDGTPSAAPGVSLLMAFVALIALFVA